MRGWLTGLVLVLSGALALPAGAEIEHEIAVTGSAVAAVEPKYATINVRISSQSKKAAEATRRTAEIHQNVVNAIGELDVLDVRTQDYRVAPQWKRDERNQPEKFLGYVANHTVLVSLSEIEIVGQVVDAAIQAGAVDVGSIQFHAEITDSLRQATLDAAVGQARSRAETIAAAAGGSLGELIEVSTADAARAMRMEIPRGYTMADCCAGSPTRITPGAKRIEFTVLARWRFVEAGESTGGERQSD